MVRQPDSSDLATCGIKVFCTRLVTSKDKSAGTGFFYLSSRDNVSLLWNQAAAGISLELIGYWRAGILEDKNNGLDEMEIEGLRKKLEEDSGRFGDRRCHLTVIGDKAQVDTFANALSDCFLTGDEIEHWQAGGEFPDPWPDSYATRRY